jgi:hypothetical protein
MLRRVQLLVGSVLVFVATGLWVLASTETVSVDGILVGVGLGLGAGVAVSYIFSPSEG